MSNRTLQNEIGRCVRIQWLMGIALSLGAMAFILVGYLPAIRQQRTMRDEISTKRNELRGNESRARTLPIIALEVEQLRSRLERFDKKLPRQQELGQFIKDFTQLSQQSSLRKVDIRPGEPRRSALLSELPIAMTFEGDFRSVFLFLRQAEDMQRLTRVQSVKIRSTGSSQGGVEVQLALNIYFLEG